MSSLSTLYVCNHLIGYWTVKGFCEDLLLPQQQNLLQFRVVDITTRHRYQSSYPSTLLPIGKGWLFSYLPKISLRPEGIHDNTTQWVHIRISSISDILNNIFVVNGSVSFILVFLHEILVYIHCLFVFQEICKIFFFS